MTRCKSKSYKISTEFWLNYHLPQVLVSSPLCMILFWSPPEIPLPTRGDGLSPFGCLLTGVRHFTPNRRKMRRSAHPSTTRTTRVKAAIPMLYASRTENHYKYNNHIRGWWEAKPWLFFIQKNLNIVHLLLQVYFL